MSQLWIDLTDLKHWKGHLTGIQRVVFNVAEHYASDDAARFFVYEPHVGFKEVAFKDIAAPIIYKASATPSANVTRNRVARISARIVSHNILFAKRNAKALYRHSPATAQKIARYYYRQLRPIDDVLKVDKQLEHPFHKNDVVFLPGASWHLASQIVNLGWLKSEVGLRIVHVVYDMIPELYPQFFGQGFGDVYIKHMFNVFSISDHLLAISENTKRDVQNFQDKMLLPKIPVTVFRLGDSPTRQAASSPPDDRIEAGKFILAVGTLEIRKNYLLLYYIWRKAASMGKSLPKLVIVGQPGWLSSDSMYLLHFDPHVRDSVIVLQDTNDKDLAWLYKNCLFTVWPAWYEGWGLPVAESLNYGKLCISSNASSMPEIAGDLIPYFDPFDTMSALRLILQYIDDPKQLHRAEENIRNKYKSVGWERAYQECRTVTDSMAQMSI